MSYQYVLFDQLNLEEKRRFAQVLLSRVYFSNETRSLQFSLFLGLKWCLSSWLSFVFWVIQYWWSIPRRCRTPEDPSPEDTCPEDRSTNQILRKIKLSWYIIELPFYFLDFQELAKEAVIQYNKNNPNQPPHVLKKIVKATTQVVSGILYNLELEIAPESSNGPSKKINVTHVSKPWISQEKTFEITEIL